MLHVSRPIQCTIFWHLTQIYIEDPCAGGRIKLHYRVLLYAPLITLFNLSMYKTHLPYLMASMDEKSFYSNPECAVKWQFMQPDPSAFEKFVNVRLLKM